MTALRELVGKWLLDASRSRDARQHALTDGAKAMLNADDACLRQCASDLVCGTCANYERNAVKRPDGVIAPTTVCMVRSGEWQPDDYCSRFTKKED